MKEYYNIILISRRSQQKLRLFVFLISKWPLEEICILLIYKEYIHVFHGLSWFDSGDAFMFQACLSFVRSFLEQNKFQAANKW